MQGRYIGKRGLFGGIRIGGAGVRYLYSSRNRNPGGRGKKVRKDMISYVGGKNLILLGFHRVKNSKRKWQICHCPIKFYPQGRQRQKEEDEVFPMTNNPLRNSAVKLGRILL